ncbi:MAG: NAD(P)/FAD-dependent oxidoreductase [Phycisphaerae bacterium]|nr:NAD(P)/FAD-dependent oxidoreductase [Gemmatimonadaceae bacterium]
MTTNNSRDHVPHVVIIGGGFGGLAAARELSKAPVRITLVDRNNHHVFQPLLYQVATAGLAPSDITVPIRWRLQNQQNATVLLAEVTAIDPEAKTVQLDVEPNQLRYDFLVVAAGARHAYFGHPEWEAAAPGLKSIEDAHEIRQRFLLAFEHAEMAATEEERAAHLTFVVVGGGPTGVELAGAMSEIARGKLHREFRRSDPRKARVLLIEAGPRLLPSFPEDLASKAKHMLERLHVEVQTGVPVTRVERDAVWVGEQKIAAHTIVWGAGNVASFLGAQVGGTTDRAGRVKVSPDMSVPAHPEIFIVGDLSYVERPDGRPVPAVAPTANQTGAHAAKMIVNTLNNRPRTPFKYFNKGELATIGRSKAIAAFGKIHLSGTLTWLLWLFVHLLYLAGFRNRLSVLIQWGYAYLTFQRGVRLISDTWHPAPVADRTNNVPLQRLNEQ